MQFRAVARITNNKSADNQETHCQVLIHRVQAKGSWNKLAVVTAETDTDTILNHALIQARRRGDL
jgi:hypothetical protein